VKKNYDITQVIFKELVQKTKDNTSIDSDLVKKAFEMAHNAHKGQFRASNDPYIIHPLEVAKIVADLKMDTATIVTALLHDTIEDTMVTYDNIKDSFGESIANMVKVITKLKTVETKNSITNNEEKKAENYRTLICAISKDLRVLIVKLADRLHNMRTLHYIDNASKRKMIARETMDIYAALAERIGLHHFKNELQRLAFAELYPKEKKNIEEQLILLRKHSKGVVENIVSEIENVLAKSDVGVTHVSGREKEIYSIWRKIQNKKISFDDLSDVLAFRIIAQSISDCYKIVCVIHNNYHMVHAEFKDYISTPKTNGYKSLHTTIIGPGNKKIEVQIRTEEMHKVADFGFAAHWRYKQKSLSQDEGEHFAWMSEMVSILQHSNSAEEILENSKLEMHYHKVFCFTPKGELISLPKKATALDFAFHIDPDIALRCTGAIINKEAVPIGHRIDNGDQIEIIYAEQYKATELWEELLYTGKAKIELKKYLSKSKRNSFIEIGKSLYTKKLQELGIKYDESKIKLHIKDLTRCDDINELFHLLGKNQLHTSDVISKIYAVSGHKNALFRLLNFIKKMFNGQNIKSSTITEAHKLFNENNVHFSECCFPIMGEKIIKILDANKGYCIHRAKCNKISSLYKASSNAEIYNWKISRHTNTYKSKIILLLSNQLGALNSVTNSIFELSIKIFNITTTNKFEDFLECSLILEVKDVQHLNQLIEILKNIESIYSVIRYMES
jgi:GTP pyrophosphokinase